MSNLHILKSRNQRETKCWFCGCVITPLNAMHPTYCMNKIKPVYQQRREFDEWEDIPKDTYDMRVNGKYQVRILYPAAAYEALQKENAAQAKRIAELEAQIEVMRLPDDVRMLMIRGDSASKNGE